MSKRRKPRQVERAAEAARRHLESQPQDTGVELAPGDEPGSGEGETPSPDPEPSNPSSGEGEAPPETPPESVAPESAPPEGEETWEQKYRSLQGKYSAEVPRLNAEVRRLNEVLQERDEQIRSLEEKLQAAPQSAKSAGGDTEAAIEDLRKVYGDELANSIQEEVNAVWRKVDERVSSLEREHQKVREEQQSSTQQAFYRQLSERVPDFLEINEDRRFHEWLEQVDPLSGETRQTLLNRAENAMDAGRVAAFFEQWKAATKTHEERPREPSPAPQKGRTGETPSGKPLWSRADIKRFYDEKREGKYRTNPEKARRIEQEIHQAIAEGRVQ